MKISQTLLLLPALVALSSNQSLAACKIESSSLKVQWTGFKTSKKVPVSGVFTKVNLQGGEGSDARTALQSTQFTIDGTAVDSGDKARDAKIGAIFFGGLSGGKISGKIKKIEKDYVHVNLTMNGVTRPVSLKLNIQGTTINAKGSLDIFDFSGGNALAALTKACYEKHEGKTWSEAGINITAQCK